MSILYTSLPLFLSENTISCKSLDSLPEKGAVVCMPGLDELNTSDSRRAGVVGRAGQFSTQNSLS